MKKLPLIAAFAAVAGSASAQNPRASVQVDLGVGPIVAPAIATDGDTSSLLYKDGLDNSVWVNLSDGRGLDWGPSTRVDDDLSGANKYLINNSLIATGGNMYAVWRDERNSFDDDLYFSSNTGAGWSANMMLDKGYPAGANPVRNFSMDAEGKNVAVLISPDNGDEDLYLVVSTDGGTTFTAAMGVTTHNGSADVDTIDVEMDGGVAHIAWIDNFTGGDAVYYSAYDFGSATFTTMDVALATNAVAALADIDDPVQISVDGSTIAVSFQADVVSTKNETWVNVSLAGTWGGDQRIGAYTAGVDDCDNSTVLVSGNMVVVAWEDNRSGSDDAYVMSADISGGAAVFGGETLVSAFGAGYPRLSGSGDYMAVATSTGAFPNSAAGAVSRDGGLTWGAPFDFSDNVGFDVDYVEMAFNPLYGNFVVAWLSDDAGANHVYAGGVRSQTITPVGTFSAGNLVHFDASGFGASEDGNFYGVLLSGSTGSFLLPFGDGREVGLQNDAFMSYAIAHIPGVLSGPLAAGGGSTFDLAMPSLAPGTTINYAGIGYDAGSNLHSLTDIGSLETL